MYPDARGTIRFSLGRLEAEIWQVQSRQVMALPIWLHLGVWLHLPKKNYAIITRGTKAGIVVFSQVSSSLAGLNFDNLNYFNSFLLMYSLLGGIIVLVLILIVIDYTKLGCILQKSEKEIHLH